MTTRERRIRRTQEELEAGLPTVKEVVARLAINPNTVLKAYRELRGWVVKARRAGPDEESIEALFRDAVRSSRIEGVA